MTSTLFSPSSALVLVFVLVTSIIATTTGVLVLVYWTEELFFAIPVPPEIPLIREPKGARRFSLRTRLAYYNDCKALFHETYHKYAKHGKAVVIPSLGFRKEVVLPSSSMKWALAQPSDRLDPIAAHIELNQPSQTMGNKTVLDPWHTLLIKTDLNRMIEDISIPLNEELTRVIDAAFGADTQKWKEIELWPVISTALAQANGRFIVGLPLCRDQEYTRAALDMNNRFVINAGVVGLMPKVLRPLVARLLNIGTKKTIRKLEELLTPLWQKHIEDVRTGENVPQRDGILDHIQIMARYALEHRPEEIDDYNLIARRMSAMNLASIHQTSLQTVNLLLDIIASDREFNTVAALREEANRIIGPIDDPTVWTKKAVSQMLEADSVARETMRLHSFVNKSVLRAVVVDDFYTQDGQYLPKGTITSFLGQPPQTDPATIDDPFKYDPFRHSRKREDAKASSLVSTSPDYLVFGHGKHACPGRFFVDFIFKMLMTHVLRHYDLRFPDDYDGKRPPNYWVVEATMPPTGARILVRRRKAG